MRVKKRVKGKEKKGRSNRDGEKRRKRRKPLC